jgi:hypothetical protein
MSCSLHYCMYVIHYYYVVVSCLYVLYRVELSQSGPFGPGDKKSRAVSCAGVAADASIDAGGCVQRVCDRYIINMK